MVNKQVLREVYLTKKLTLSKNEYDLRNDLIVESAKKLVVEFEAKVIHIFLPIANKKEVDLTFLKEIFPTKQFVIPKTERGGNLSHYLYDDSVEIEINNWGIPEPTLGKRADINHIDLIFVPLIVGDKLGHRIGYGKGYYDRFLKTTRAKKIGVSLLPLLDKIDFMEATDVPLDEILTPFERRIVKKTGI